MHILLATPLYPPDVGGPATYAALLERWMPKRGHVISIVNFNKVRHLPAGIRHVVYFVQLFRAASGVGLICALDPWSTGVPAALVAFIRRKKFVVRIAGDYAWEQAVTKNITKDSLEKFSKGGKEYPFLIKLFSIGERLVAKYADSVVVPSAYLKKIILKWGIPKENIYVVKNGVPNLEDQGNRRTIRGLLRFQGKLIVSSGRLISLKRFDALIMLMPSLLEKIPDLKLLIAGDGPERDRLEKLVEKNNLEEHVALAGAMEQAILFRYIKAADVFVLNSTHETFSHQILEALSIGIPVVATNVGGTPEIIEHEKSGILVSSGNKQKLKEAIERVLTDQKLSSKLVRSGKQRVEQFTEESSALNFIQVLERA